MNWRRAVEIALGWAFILLGIAGLFLPVLQGILSILIGLSLLSHHSPRAKRLYEWLKARFPRAAGGLRRWKERVKGWFARKKV